MRELTFAEVIKVVALVRELEVGDGKVKPREVDESDSLHIPF